jgi:hypothetical protein
MVDRHDGPHPKRPTLPGPTKLGLVVMALGTLDDLVEHTLVFRTPTTGGFPLEEHLAHLIVVIGMVLVLAGIVRDGVRSSRRHPRHLEAQHHALR